MERDRANPDDVDPAKLPELVVEAYVGDYQCDCCEVYYGHGGFKIKAFSDGGLGGFRRIAVLCKWCLTKLGITIVELQLG